MVIRDAQREKKKRPRRDLFSSVPHEPRPPLSEGNEEKLGSINGGKKEKEREEKKEKKQRRRSSPTSPLIRNAMSVISVS